mgnify:CR=1 FL=1
MNTMITTDYYDISTYNNLMILIDKIENDKNKIQKLFKIESLHNLLEEDKKMKI